MPEKIDAVINAPRPTNVSTLRAYLGLVNYYHRFLPNIVTVLKPLKELLEKDKVRQWSKSCETAFLKSKELVDSDLVLTHCEPSLNLKVECDASQYGLGAVLCHVMPDNREKPIVFTSCSLSKAERNYSQINKEALALTGVGSEEISPICPQTKIHHCDRSPTTNFNS